MNNFRVTIFIAAVIVGAWYALTVQIEGSFVHRVDPWINGLVSRIEGLFSNNSNAQQNNLVRSVYTVTLFNVILLILYTVVIVISMVNWSGNNDAKIDNDDAKKWIDSIYFYGFIMTLVSLVVALGSVGGADDKNVIASTIVQNAIALSSTAAALFLRTIISLVWRFKKEELDSLGEVETALREHTEALTRATINLKTETSNVTNVMVASGSKIATSSDEYLQKIRAGIENHNLEFVKAINQTRSDFDKSLAPVALSLDNFTTKVNSIELDPKIISQNIERIFSEVVHSLGQVLVNLSGEIESKSEDLAASMNGLSNSISRTDFGQMFESQIESSLKPLSDVIEAQSEKAGEAVNAHSVITKEFIKSGITMVRSIRALAAKVDQSKAPMDGVNEAFEELRQGFTKFAAAASDIGNIDSEIKLVNSKIDQLFGVFAQRQQSAAPKKGDRSGVFSRIWTILTGRR